MEKFFVMDIETYEDDSKVIPFLFTLRVKDKIYNFFKENDDIIPFFLNKIEFEAKLENLKLAEIYTHNINFDGFILIEYFLTNNIPFKWFIRDLNLYSITFTYKGLEIRIRCSYKLLGISVKKLGEFLNENKKPFPYRFITKNNLNYVGDTPDKTFFEDDDSYLTFVNTWGKSISIKNICEDYASTDVSIVYKSLIEIFKLMDRNLIKNSFSFSSYSYKLFKKKYDKKGVCKENVFLEERNYIENAYFGGRTEIFGNRSEGLIHRYDFPGMYGSCMKEKFPCGKGYFKNSKDFILPGFYTATVKSNLKIPLLPLRIKNGKTLYPNGRFTTCLSRDEFIFFIENGGIVEKIHNSFVYESEDYIFKDFIDKFDEIKKEGGFKKIYGKQVINSLYGSFALRRENVEYVILYNDKELEFLSKEKRLKKFIKFDKMIIACIDNSKFLNPREKRNLAYAALISSKAKIKLHKNLLKLDEFYTKKYDKKYKLLYLETDSIDVCLPENRIGEKIMDVEWNKLYEDGVYISPKFYFLKGDERSRIKGIKFSKYSFEEIKDFFYSNQESLVFESQLQFYKKDFSLSQAYLDKTLRLSFYEKRIFTKNKLDTEAIEIWE